MVRLIKVRKLSFAIFPDFFGNNGQIRIEYIQGNWLMKIFPKKEIVWIEVISGYVLLWIVHKVIMPLVSFFEVDPVLLRSKFTPPKLQFFWNFVHLFMIKSLTAHPHRCEKPDTWYLGCRFRYQVSAGFCGSQNHKNLGFL